MTVAIASARASSPVASSRLLQADFEPLVRAGQVRRARHDDLARGIDGPLAINARRQPGQRAGVADQDRSAPALLARTSTRSVARSR